MFILSLNVDVVLETGIVTRLGAFGRGRAAVAKVGRQAFYENVENIRGYF